MVQSSLWDLNFLITHIHPDFLPDGERMGFSEGGRMIKHRRKERKRHRGRERGKLREKGGEL